MKPRKKLKSRLQLLAGIAFGCGTIPNSKYTNDWSDEIYKEIISDLRKFAERKKKKCATYNFHCDSYNQALSDIIKELK